MDRQPGDRSTEVVERQEGEPTQEEIRANMEETRASLADKIAALETKVIGTVEQTVETVQDTVATAKRTLDVRYQTEHHPWRMVGLAVAAGAAVGYLTGEPSAPRYLGTGPRDDYVPERPPPTQAASSAPGLFAEEWQQLKGLAIGAGMSLLRDWLKGTAPGLTDQIDQFMNRATAKLGGVPMEGPLFGSGTEQSSRPHPWNAAG